MEQANRFTSLTGILAIFLLAYSGSGFGNAGGVISALQEDIDKNADRITALEESGGGTGLDIAVDCNNDSSALRNMALDPGNTYVLTGMCDGPIRIAEPVGSYTFQGDDLGIKDDGIISPLGQVEGYVFSAYGPVAVTMDNLTISGVNYTSQSDAFVTSILIAGNASAKLSNVDVEGGDNGIYADGAYINVGSGVNITGFREEGLIAGNGSSIQVEDFINVVGALNEPGDFSAAMDAFRSGSIVISGGGTFTAGSDDGSNPDYERISMSANGNGSIRMRNSSDVTLTGAIEAIRSSEIRIQHGGTVVGAITASDQSHVRVRNLTHSGGSIGSFVGSGFTARNSVLSSGSSDDSKFVQGVSAMTLRGTSVGNSSRAGSINVAHYGFLSLQGGTNLNGRIVNCRDPAQSIQLFGATGIGAGSCI